MNQLEFINKISLLAEKNPAAQIKICVDNDLATEFGWTVHEITKVKLSIWIEFDERVFTDEDEAKNEIANELYHGDNMKLSTEEFGALVDKYFDTHSTEAICVFTGAG